MCRATPVGAVKPARVNVWRQFSTVARRQVQLILADRGYVAMLVALPFIVGLLPLTVAGHAGFGAPAPGAPPFEPKQIIALLNFGAILLGTTLTVRDLTGERVIFRREQAVGLSASAYLAAKIAVFGAVAVIQSAILTLVVTAPKFGKPAPPGAAALGSPLFELFVGVAATCVGAMMLGLAVSAMAKSSDQVIVLLAATLVTQLVLAGGFIPVTNRPLLETISMFTPARWGFAATASTADLSNLVVDREGLALAAHRLGVVLRHRDAGGVVHRLRGDRSLEDPAQGGQLGPGQLGPHGDHCGQADGEDDDRDDQVDAVEPLQHAVKQAGQ